MFIAISTTLLILSKFITMLTYLIREVSRQLDMDVDKAEIFIVNLLRESKLSAKVDV